MNIKDMSVDFRSRSIHTDECNAEIKRQKKTNIQTNKMWLNGFEPRKSPSMRHA